MNLTELIIRSLNGGQLQRLARDILEKKEEWMNIVIIGGVEGTSKTRTGIPDLLAEKNDGGQVYIEVTNDMSSTKIKSDVKKCIEALDGKKNSKIVSFLGYDPSTEIIDKCRELCKVAEIEYDYYYNGKIAKIVEEEYPELILNYVDEKDTGELICIDLTQDNFHNRLHTIVTGLKWIESDQREDLINMLYEITDNSIKHGNSNSIKVQLSENRIRIIDDGQPFNMLNPGKNIVKRGGYITLDFFVEKYEGQVCIQYQRVGGCNIYAFGKNNVTTIKLETDDKCTINIPHFRYGRSQIFTKTYDVVIRKECDPVILDMTQNMPPVSVSREIIEEILMKIPDEKKIRLIINNERKELMEYFLKRSGLDKRIDLVVM